jgi:putative transposase
MPRGPRLDAPGVLHHIMARGIEGRTIFQDVADRRDFVARLGVVTAAGAWEVYAWALLPNRLHLLVRTGQRPLGRTMGALLAGYAGAFNRRHNRRGHLFQNRYRSVVVEEEPYLLELTRYIHLNPLRVGLVRNLRALDRCPWTGHRGLLGTARHPWQTVEGILGQFGRRVGEARRRYREFVEEGIRQGRRPDLEGGGLRRSAGGWEGLTALRRGREGWAFDERILGSGPFVERLLAEVAPGPGPTPARAWRAFAHVRAQLATAFEVSETALAQGSRRRPVAAARAAVGAVAVHGLGLPVTRVARALGVTPMPLVRALSRGRQLLAVRGLTVETVAQESLK